MAFESSMRFAPEQPTYPTMSTREA